MNIKHNIKKIISTVFSDAVMEIKKVFPTDQHCVDEIYRMGEKQLRCNRCDGGVFLHEHGERQAVCKACGKKKFFTAGTLFDHMRKPRPMLTALVAATNGVMFNPHMLHRECGTAYQSAYTIFEKITNVANNILEKNSVPVSSSEFDEVICRRSSETDARRHPVTEQEQEFTQMMAHDPQHLQDAIGKFFGIPEDDSTSECVESDNAQLIYNLHGHGTVSLEHITEKSELEVVEITSALIALVGCGFVVQLSGDRYKRAPNMATLMALMNPDVEQKISHANELLRIVFHGVSRRHMQRYVAAFWCFVGRSKLEQNDLVKRCFGFVKRTKAERVNYISPIVLSFPTNFTKSKSPYSSYSNRTA